MNKQLRISILILLFSRLGFSQTYDTIIIKADKGIAINRCYLCYGLMEKHDSISKKSSKELIGRDSNYCTTNILGYLMEDTIQKIIEDIKLHVKYSSTDEFYDNSDILITYKFYHGKLIEANEENPGASYTYYFHNGSMVSERAAVDDLGYFTLNADEALIYAREDEKMILHKMRLHAR